MKKIDTKTDEKKVLENSERREFLDKFGKLTGAIPVGMLVLMGPTQSKANSSDNDGGGGFEP